MNARAEAYERLEGRHETRVLEPSAVADGPWFADDPAVRGEAPAGRTLVSPVGTGDVRWDDLASTDPGLANGAQIDGSAPTAASAPCHHTS